MTNEEVIDYILYERLLPVIDSFNCYEFEDGDLSAIRKLRELYQVWNDETVERLFCGDFIENNPDNFFKKCDSLILKEIGYSQIMGRIDNYRFNDMLSQMRICMLKDKYNPFFKLKRITQNKKDIEKDFQ